MHWAIIQWHAFCLVWFHLCFIFEKESDIFIKQSHFIKLFWVHKRFNARSKFFNTCALPKFLLRCSWNILQTSVYVFCAMTSSGAGEPNHLHFQESLRRHLKSSTYCNIADYDHVEEGFLHLRSDRSMRVFFLDSIYFRGEQVLDRAFGISFITSASLPLFTSVSFTGAAGIESSVC